MKKVKMKEKEMLKISLDIGCTMDYTIEKNRIFQYVGEFTHKQTGKEMIAFREDDEEEYVTFAIEKDKVLIL